MAIFSIILPVRNGGEYIKVCVASILNQTYQDFDLLILENNSNDGTKEWLANLNDPRVKIYNSDIDLTIEENWARVIAIPKNEFMTMIGHDDLLHPDYLDVMNGMISQFPIASLYQTHFNYIDAKGNLIRPCVPIAETMNDYHFLKNMLEAKIDINGSGFMMRSKDYEKIGGIPPFANLLFADFALWHKMTMLSFMAVSPKCCFSYRLHKSMTTISSNQSFKSGFEQLIEYLLKVKTINETNRSIIDKYAGAFITSYCRSISHRMLRSPLSARKGFTVSSWVGNCQQFSNKLLGENQLEIQNSKGLKLALLIDNYSMLRSLFLIWKKLFKKPIYK